MGKYHLSKATNNHYFWTLRAGNGERILLSEMYTTKGAAFGGITSCKENSPYDVRYARLTSTDGKPYFVLKAANGQVIGASEMYSSAQARDSGIESCKTNGPSSPTQDDTGEK
jgi:uncharacterized protein YegP (UPF0339 family)